MPAEPGAEDVGRRVVLAWSWRHPRTGETLHGMTGGVVLEGATAGWVLVYFDDEGPLLVACYHLEWETGHG